MQPDPSQKHVASGQEPVDPALERAAHELREISKVIAPGGTPNIPEPEPETLRAWLAYNGPMLLFLAVIVGLVVFFKGLVALKVGFLVMVGLGLVIFLHELGHFAVAKWCDVYVDTFSIGFGPALPGCKFQYGETTYMIALFPLGGYVKMLGEGAENDEEDTDPRSFKNKPVWQRMAIISAGVIMNVILGAACFIFVFRMHGERQLIGGISAVEAGSPAWVKGAKSGDMIKRIDTIENPSFNDLRHRVPLSGAGAMAFVFGPPGGPYTETTIEPRRAADDLHPVIGVVPPDSLELASAKSFADSRPAPVFWNSAAAQAKPPIQYGDRIVATTDPQQAGKVTDLPPNTHNPDSKQRDYFEFRRRLQDLAGQDLTLRVEREGTGPVDIQVPPAYHRTLGLRMKMGQIVAVRPTASGDSPVRYANQVVDGKKVDGDVIHAAEVREATGFKTRWTADRAGWNAESVQTLLGALSGGMGTGQPLVASAVPALVLGPTLFEQASDKALVRIFEKDLDPVRLPFELKQWARRAGAAAQQVRLTVNRAKQNIPNAKDSFDLPWDEGYRYSTEISQHPSSPTSVPELGVAYHVETTVMAVRPNSPAARARTEGASGEVYPLKEGDVIREIRFFQSDKGESKAPDRKGQELKQHQFAYFFFYLQNEHPGRESGQVKLKVERNQETFEVIVQAEDDKSWPRADRGLVVMADQRLKKAETIGEAVQMGMNTTNNFIMMVYKMLVRLVEGRLSIDNMGGPLTIFTTGYGILEYDIYGFIFFLGAISINLAVVNFLPIPVLDGGHFVFLVYEGLRGKPASKRVLIYTTYTGLLLIGSLMLFVLYLDIKRLPFWPG